MRKKLVVSLAVVIVLGGWFAYTWWASAIRQPFGFSHAQHVKSSIPCSTCHGEVTKEELPQVAVCKDCHTSMNPPSTTRWIRIYRVAPDIIFFHKDHTDACATCHNAITNAKFLIHESRFKMDFCMDCHAQRAAKNDCAACHKNRKP